ncbi:NADPH:quinone oxidoreductase family protein [Rubrimonas cliftonensis]|uniref:NADPH2:quinone reductase n=1 Tax=Rubrimonas cliftonensis TaxID=89524 RepID=A0A1H3Z908_9RHOB|nr:NADPH:quinone oxidoreductase family protein [Rubrimonas cliftonensis]SEA20216.1 NADPH2:quinone reductase [Rubrimonas cliftonensis]
MRAMRAAEKGAALRLDEVATPQPGPGEALIRVRACGLNFADTLMVKGTYQETPDFPLTPGLEICGEIVALGAGAAGPEVGARVAALCGAGGLADYATAPAATCVAAPAAMDDATAAALQVAYGTSHVALDHKARMRPGERLLVLGAGGGVGLTAIEIGKLMGAEVIACANWAGEAGAAKAEAARSRGADHLIDADPEGLRDAVKALGGADVVYDPVGGALWREAMRAANFGARLLPIGFASGEVPQIPANIVMVKNVDVLGLYWGAYYRRAPHVLAESFRTLLDWWEKGRIRPHVSHVLPLEQAEAGLDLLRARAASGKVVVRVSE